MKPFDLERALAGDPVVTRDGRKAKIIYHYLKGAIYYSIVAVVEEDDDTETVLTYTLDGEAFIGNRSMNDLFMDSIKHEGWINIYRSEDFLNPHYAGKAIYDTEKRAKTGATSNCIATTKIEWEE